MIPFKSKRYSTWLIDTSGLMEGRLVLMVRQGLVRNMCIPDFVLSELQDIADTADRERRARARMALEQVATLRNINSVDIKNGYKNWDTESSVDERLVALALAKAFTLYSADFNLVLRAEAAGGVCVCPQRLHHVLDDQIRTGMEVSVVLEHSPSSSNKPNDVRGYISQPIRHDVLVKPGKHTKKSLRYGVAYTAMVVDITLGPSHRTITVKLR